jgi:hypothetical protein
VRNRQLFHPWIGARRNEGQRDLRQALADAAEHAARDGDTRQGGDEGLRHRFDIDRPVERRAPKRLGEGDLAVAGDGQTADLIECPGCLDGALQQSGIERHGCPAGIDPRRRRLAGAERITRHAAGQNPQRLPTRRQAAARPRTRTRIIEGHHADLVPPPAMSRAFSIPIESEWGSNSMFCRIFGRKTGSHFS